MLMVVNQMNLVLYETMISIIMLFIGGGIENAAGPIFSTISGGRENFISGESQEHSTISGGSLNGISNEFFASVITGGFQNRMCGSEDDSDGLEFCTISGGDTNRCSANSAVATGGINNVAVGTASVAIGGIDNTADRLRSTSVGGSRNFIGGAFSIGLGVGAEVSSDSSMVINLIPDSFFPLEVADDENNVIETVLVADTDGQFLVKAESHTFQIGKNSDGLSIQITEDNIKNLINALENAA